jgi:hypothetical protein
VEYIIPLWILCGLIGAAVGSSKNLGPPGFVLGFLLGPIGIMIVVMMSGNRIPCPFCREKMNRRATVCPHCQRDVGARAMPIPRRHASGYLMNLLILLIVIAAIIVVIWGLAKPNATWLQ